MSREILDEIVDQIADGEKEDLSEILSTCISYGFLDDIKLSKLLDLDLTDIDELLDDTSELSDRTWKEYSKKLTFFFKRERLKYERIYYSQKP